MMILPVFVSAQEANMCTTDALQASVAYTEETRDVEDTLFVNVAVGNGSEYLLGGISVILAIYADDADMVPEYWSVITEGESLAGGLQNSFARSIDVSALPQGQYTYRAIAGQGDAMKILGESMLDVNPVAQTFNKNGSEHRTLEFSYVLNGLEITNTETVQNLTGTSPVVLEILTTNTDSKPVFGSELRAVFTEGHIPLGNAVKEKVRDVLKLLPGSARATKVTDTFITPGTHHAYITAVSMDVAYPIEHLEIVVDSEGKNESYTYINQIGVEGLELAGADDIAVCLQSYGDTYIQGETGVPVQIEVTRADDVYVEQKSTDAESGRTLSFTPRLSYNQDAYFTVALLEPRQRSRVTSREEAEAKEFEGLVSVEEISFSLNCMTVGGCIVSDEDVLITNEQSKANNAVLIGVLGLVLLLIVYLLWLRFGHDDDHHHQLSKHELQ